MYKILVDGKLFCSSKIEELAVINPQIDQEANKAGTFTLIVPPTHPYYDMIKRRSSIIQVFRDDEEEPLFEGICTETTVDFWKQKKITCEGELTFLNDSILRLQEWNDRTSRQILESFIYQHNLSAESEKQFTVGQVTVSVMHKNYAADYISTMQAIKEAFVDQYGGYIRCRHVEGVRYLDYLAYNPRTNNQVIRIGQNLLDLSQNIDTEEIATVIIPLGASLGTQTVEGYDDRLTIEAAPSDDMHPEGADYVYSESAVESLGWIEKVITWDNQENATYLKNAAESYLNAVQFENLVITAKAIDLGLTSDEFNQFKLLDQVRVVSAPHGLDAYFPLTKISYHLNNPEQDTITLGKEGPVSLSAKAAGENEKVKKEIERRPTSAAVDSAINNATALITGAEGGYVVIERNSNGQPIEIKIQDALNNPTKIWRWNQNGFGYSNDGGTTYGLAMTMDGAIVANYITSGTMYADRIKGGTLKLGGDSNEDGVLQIVNASNQEIGHWDKDGIVLKQGTVGGWYITEGSIISYDGTTEANSLRKVVMYKYVSAADPWAFAVYTRATTSDNWVGQFAITYNGNLVSQDAINVYPTNSNYGLKVYGVIHATDKIAAGDGKCIIQANGHIDTESDAYFGGAGDVSGHNLVARNGLNCYGGDNGGFFCQRGANVSNLYVASRYGEDSCATFAAGIRVNGNIIVTGQVGPPSDFRLKKDIKDLKNATDLLKKLRPCSFNYNAKDIPDNQKRLGLIAQEVENILGDYAVVFEDKEGYKGIDYTSLVPLLIEGFKEQQKEIEALRKEIEK